MRTLYLTAISSSYVVSSTNSNHRHIIFFFFQAEDGIRDDLVTGVQTCALPIYMEKSHRDRSVRRAHRGQGWRPARREQGGARSEERRVGKECRSRWSPDQ